MSKENVEIIRRVFGELERGNFWALRDYLDADVHVTWINPIYGDLGGDSHGVEELTRGMRAVFEVLEGVTASAEELIEAGDQVVTVALWRGRGKGSGLPNEARQSMVWKLSGGKVTRLIVCADREEALEEAARLKDPPS